MATRASIPTISLPDLRSAAAWRPALPADRRTLVWQTVTAPWWVWSDIPKLPLPSRNPALPEGGLAGDWVVSGLDRIATRVWIQRMMSIVARGIWLTLLVGCFWLVVDLAGGPALNAGILLAIGVVVMLCSLVVAALSRPNRAQVARMLDRSFALQERVTTALGNIGEEIPAESERASVVYLQVADAANALTIAQGHSAFRLRPPARELVMAIALGLAFAGLAFARGAGGSVPDVQSNVVPAFVPAAEHFVQPEAEPTVPPDQAAPSVADVQQMVQTSLDNQQDLQTLADALADHAVTSDAANLIDQGKYSEAAEELRDVANQADQLSDAARADLASDLSQAASQMSSDNQSLSDATQQAADGLKQGGDQARDGVRDLANAVEQSGQQVQSSESLDQAMQQAQQNESSSSSPSQSQAADQGQSSPNQDSGASDQQQEPGSSASGQDSGQPGQAESTSGADAEAGTGEDPNASSGQPGEGAPADANAQATSGEQPGSGENENPAGGNASGDSSDPSASDQTSETSDSNRGSGAGSESGAPPSEGNADAKTGGAAQNESAGKDPSKSSVSDASETGTDTSGAGDDPHEAVTLDRAPQGESVQTSSNSGSSSLGPGAGVTVSNGSTQQGDVGQTGPDSNHVPPEYRSIVESYFSDKDGDG